MIEIWKIYKSLSEKVEFMTSYLFDLSKILFLTIGILIVELIKSEIMEKLKMTIREATLVWRMEPTLRIRI